MYFKDNKGFTLLEVLTVIIIITILIVMGLPLYMNYINQANVSEIKTYISKIKTAEQKYYQLNSEYFVSNDTSEIQNRFDLNFDKKIRNLWEFSITKPDSTAEYIDILAKAKSGSDISHLRVKYSFKTGEFTVIE